MVAAASDARFVINLRVPKKMAGPLSRAKDQFEKQWQGLPLSRNDVMILLLNRGLATLNNTAIVDALPEGRRRKVAKEPRRASA